MCFFCANFTVLFFYFFSVTGPGWSIW